MTLPAVMTPTTMLAGGRFYALESLHAADIDIAALIGRMGGMPRFCGQTIIRRRIEINGLDTARHFTVLHHTWAMLAMLGEGVCARAPALTIACALHDAHEPLTGDLPTPFRRLLDPQALDDAEAPLVTAVMEAGGLTEAEAWHYLGDIRLTGADRLAGAAEAAEFMACCPATRDWWAGQTSLTARHFVRRAAQLSDAELRQGVLTALHEAQAHLPAWRTTATPAERGE